MEKIAAILTVHNRKQKTLSCLQHLFSAIDSYNQQHEERIAVTVFLTDDGCSDGTAAAVRQALSERDIRILQGDGSLFWAGGMRCAWQAAIDSGTPWDYCQTVFPKGQSCSKNFLKQTNTDTQQLGGTVSRRALLASPGMQRKPHTVALSSQTRRKAAICWPNPVGVLRW